MRIPPTGPERSELMVKLAAQLVADPGPHPNGIDVYADEQERCDAAEYWGEQITSMAYELAMLVFVEHGDRTPSPPASDSEPTIAEMWAKNPKLREIAEMYERLERDIRLKRSRP